MPLKLAIMISGRGSNMEALIRYAQRDDVPAEVVLVLADRKAKGIETASNLGIKIAIHDDEDGIRAALESAQAEVIFLAGYMRILSRQFCDDYHGRLFNIHPSLLPRHKGLDTHARAIAAKDSIHGCSVHLVSKDMDGGPVLNQLLLKIHPQDTPETLAERVLALEHKLYPSLLGDLAKKDGNLPLHIELAGLN